MRPKRRVGDCFLRRAALLYSREVGKRLRASGAESPWPCWRGRRAVHRDSSRYPSQGSQIAKPLKTSLLFALTLESTPEFRMDSEEHQGCLRDCRSELWRS